MVQQTAPAAWISMGMLALLALGLAFVGLIVVVTVLMASGRAGLLSRQLKSAGLVVLLILPVLAVLAWVSLFRIARMPDPMVSFSPAKMTKTRSAELVHVSSDQPVVPQTVATQSQPIPPVAPVASTPSSPPIVEASVQRRIHRAALANRAGDLAAEKPEVLRVRETLPKEPAWASGGAVPGDQSVLVPLSSQRFATLGEAEEQVTQLAVDYVKDFYQNEYPLQDRWNVPVSLIDRHAVNALVGEEQDKDFGNGFQGKMYRAHLRLDLNSKLRQALHDSWHDQIVWHRLRTLASGFGMVTMMFAASAGYFRLNDLTQGQFRGRLKLAALAFVGAAGLGVLALV